MEAAGEDEYEVRQQRKVQAESQQMIPDSEKRLAKAVSELEELVSSTQDELAETDEFKKAEAALKLANPE
ncbi:tubulin-specific chaperone A [Rhodotorula toruloides]|uniref:Tubulin-specific chaperone A n=1 Tax=Rhodotorula toruloides TaxID=5286 RepID=A0A511KJU6_RHOTO|nr:tubulin-specific chaperone A [Rhodotorula toruloides]